MPIETALWIYVLVLAFLCGACAGSFVNCAADRYAAKQSIFRGRSHCPVCGHTLGILDLFPIFSYIFLRGKCRHCGAKIPVRCLITELCGGLLFLTAAMRFGVSFQTLEYCLLFAALFAVALIDFDTMEIPDGIHLFGIFVFLVFLPAYPSPQERLMEGLLGALVFGGGMLAVSLIMDAILKRDSLGGGDIKLFAVLGLFNGVWRGLFHLILSCLTGILLYVLARQKNEFPFGPAICIAAWVTALVGQEIIDLYLSIIP